MSVIYELHGDIAMITLDRPDSFNAITRELSTRLVAALSRSGDEARAAVITGSGRAFCAGADLGEIAAGYEREGPNLGQVLDETFHPAIEALVDAPVPTVGAINGVAAGAGLGLALACDLRVMSRDSFLVSAFAGIALAPDSGTTWWLTHHLGVSRALDITMTNRRVSAPEALEVGLCVEVADADDLVESAKARASAMSDLDPEALVTTRRLIREAASVDLPTALAAEKAAQDRLGRRVEHSEGISAFLEKRKPDYRNPKRA